MAPPLPHRPGRTTVLLLAAVLALPLARGLYRLGVPNVWIDEAATWYGVSGSWGRLLEHALAGDDCGGFLYAALLKPWTALAGTSEVALRLPSVLFTVLLAGVVFAVGRRLWDHRAGLYGALVVGLYPVVFLQSRQARCYALELLLYALALLGLVLLLQGRRQAGGALLAAAGSLLVVTHVYGVAALAGLGAVAAAAPFAGRGSGASPAPAIARRAASNLAPFLPPLLVLAGWIAAFWPGIEERRTEFWLHGSVARTYLGLVEYVAPVALAVAVLLWRARRRDGSRHPRSLAAAAVLLALPILLAPYLASLASRGGHHFVLERYFLPLAVPVALAFGYLLARLPRALALPAALLLVLASVAKPGNLRAYDSDVPHGARSEELAAYLKEVREPGEPVFVAPGYQQLTLAYYGVDGVSLGGWECQGLAEHLAALGAGAVPGRPPGSESGTVWVAHFGCPGESLEPAFTRVVSRRSFGSLELVELRLGGPPGPPP